MRMKAGEVVRLREAMWLTQTDFAHKAGLAASTLNRLEQQTKLPRFRTLLAVADALGVPPEELVEHVDEAGVA
jgi:transcriptional regulator with XRE-family HTH domain